MPNSFLIKEIVLEIILDLYSAIRARVLDVF